jgi:hypothetical protein
MYVILYAVFVISLHLMQVNKAAYMYNICYRVGLQNFKISSDSILNAQQVRPKPKYMKAK